MRRSIVFVVAVLALALAAPATSIAAPNGSQKLRCKAGQKAVTVKGKARCVAAAASKKKKAAEPVDVQILGINVIRWTAVRTARRSSARSSTSSPRACTSTRR
jgi:hypothetical protein